LPNPLFSTYSQGENRITASLLAAFERLSFGIVERLLQALCRETVGPLLTFTNQPQGKLTAPDARIAASFAYWIETKAVKGAVNKEQLSGHLRALDEEHFTQYQRLLVLTPDGTEPSVIGKIGDQRLVWASFDDLAHAIQELLQPSEDILDPDRPYPGEQERAMLRELLRFLNASGVLSGAENRVLVVAARVALDLYLRYAAYMCQPNRAFRPSARMAFYVDKRIDRRVPKVIGQPIESIQLHPDHIAALDTIAPSTRRRLEELVKALERDQHPNFSATAKVILLSGPDDSETEKLSQDIDHNLPYAFVQGQRYVPWSVLKQSPRTTSALRKSVPSDFY